MLRLKEDTTNAGSYDPYTCKVRDYFFEARETTE